MIQAVIKQKDIEALFLRAMRGESLGLAIQDGMLVFQPNETPNADFSDTILFRVEDTNTLCSLIIKNGQVESFSSLFRPAPTNIDDYKVILKNDTKIKGFTSQADAAKFLGVAPSTVSKALARGKRIKGWIIEKR